MYDIPLEVKSQDTEIVPEIVTPNITNNPTFLINNILYTEESDGDYMMDSLICCLLYFCCICTCPCNIFCGIYSYLLAHKDKSNNNILRFIIKSSIITSIFLVITIIIIAFISGNMY